MNQKYCILILLISLSFKVNSSNVDSSGVKKWLTQFESNIPDIPFEKGIAGSYIGISNNVVIVAGGSYFDSSSGKDEGVMYSDSIFVLFKEGNIHKWKSGGILPFSAANGAAVSIGDGVLCIGGENNIKKIDNVFLLRWDAKNQTIVFSDQYPALPQASSSIAASVINNSVYVAGGKTQLNQKEIISNNFWKLNLEQGVTGSWQNLEPWSEKGRFGASMIRQTNGEHTVLFLLGGKTDSGHSSDLYTFNPNIRGNNQWKKLSNMPGTSMSSPALAIGSSHIFVFSYSGRHDFENPFEVKDSFRLTGQVFSYNTITDVWYNTGELHQGVLNTTAVIWDSQIVIPGGQTWPEKSTPEILTAIVNSKKEGRFSLIDYIIMILYLALMAGMGFIFSSKQKSSKDFFLGGKSIPFWAAGLSMMATSVSSIGFMAIPGKVFATNWSYFAGVFTWFIVVPIVIYAFLPFYQKLSVTTVFEYLEKRFNSFIRLFVAALYFLFQLIGRLGIIIFLPSIALSAVTGMNILVCILIIGLLSTVYTVLGGMEMVIWSDVIQAIVLFGGIILAIVYIVTNIEGGATEIVNIAWNDSKFSFGSFDLNLTTAVVWVIVIGNIFSRLGTMTTDQSVVQKYLSTKNEKEMAKSMWVDVAVSIPWALCVFGLGTALYVFYKVNPQLIDPVIANDEIVPFFIRQNLPQGLKGVIIAAIFAASMSSVDSSIHSSTTILMRDFFRRRIDSKTELRKVSAARWITGVLGLIGIAIAILMTFFNITSVWDIVLEIAGLFIGAITGVFFLGILTIRANGKGAVIGTLASAAILLVVKNYTSLHFFLYSGVGIISCIIIGYISSFLFYSDRNLEGLTIYTVNKKENK